VGVFVEALLYALCVGIRYIYSTNSEPLESSQFISMYSSLIMPNASHIHIQESFGFDIDTDTKRRMLYVNVKYVVLAFVM
jgi:hypothetical protein